jgi:hypothetical protein
MRNWLSLKLLTPSIGPGSPYQLRQAPLSIAASAAERHPG